MTVFSLSRSSARVWYNRNPVIPIMVASAVTAGAIALVAYLLWPTWGAEGSSSPERLPVSVGGTLFNVPSAAIRMKIQRHSGPQERIDLTFAVPSLEPPEAAKHVSADAVAPDMRLRTIYPRYLEQASTPGQDGLTMRAFRNNAPYGNEDMFLANTPGLTARCTRDTTTPGMCLSERRIVGADLTFRFPRSWLAQWRDISDAMDRLALQLHGSK